MSKTDLSKILEEALKPYIDEQFKSIKDRLKAIEGRVGCQTADIQAATEIALGVGGETQRLLSALRGAFADQDLVAKAAPKTPEQPYPRIALPTEPAKIAVSQPAEKQPEPKGFEALEPILAQKQAEVVAQMDKEFRVGDLKGRILYFLHECGPQTPYDLKRAKVWRSADSVTHFLENMEAERVKLVRFLRAEKKWAITTDGIEVLNASIEEPAPEPTKCSILKYPDRDGHRILTAVEPPKEVKPTQEHSYIQRVLLELNKGACSLKQLLDAGCHDDQKKLQTLLYMYKQRGYLAIDTPSPGYYSITELGVSCIPGVEAGEKNLKPIKKAS